MATINPTSVRSAVIKNIKKSEMYIRLKQENPEITVYKNAIIQGLKDGCFFVKSINPARKNQLSRVRMHTERIDVRYFLPNTPDREDIALQVASELMDILELIEMEDSHLRGKNIEQKTVDGVLHVYVAYSFRAYSPSEDEKMETLQIGDE